MRFVWFQNLILILLCTACAVPQSPDGIDEAVPGLGKSDKWGDECTLEQVLVLLNEPVSDFDYLYGIGVHKQAAKNLDKARAGEDGLVNTADDLYFTNMKQVDEVPWVGPAAIKSLANAVSWRCPLEQVADALFSPEAYPESHLQKTIDLIDEAQFSVDFAMYSFRDYGLLDALQRAKDRGVSIRALMENAKEDRKEPEGTMSAKVEDLGIDVRWVNKIMHHKFVLIDGPRSSIYDAYVGTLVTGSANWSYSAGTKYDESTLVLKGYGELLLSFQREFNLMWANSRDFEWNSEVSYFDSMAIVGGTLIDILSTEAWFTSANFKTSVTSYGPTFSIISGMNTISDRLVALIDGAGESIDIASGHLRSRPVYEALVAKVEENPEIQVRVYLDGQEYVSEWAHNNQLEDQQQCLNDAGESVSNQQKCLDKGFRYSYAAHLAGMSLRFKYYAYRWHYTYAAQMHHKYLLVDGRYLAMGSYNLSDNAEHNTFENLLIFDGNAVPELVQSFKENFDAMWQTGVDEKLYDGLISEIENATEGFPIVFDSMALTWDQVSALKGLIQEHCPQVNSEEYRNDPGKHTWCDFND